MKKMPIWLVMLALSAISLAVSTALVASRKAAAEPPPQQIQWIKAVTSRPKVVIRSLESAPGKIAVHAEATLGNTARSQELIWYLKIWTKARNDETGEQEWKVVWEQDYAHQTFTLNAGQFANPTFDQALDLPPADYTVDVGIKEKRGVMEDGEVIVRNTPIASRLGHVKVN